MISGSVTMVPIAAILYLMVMKPGEAAPGGP